MGRADIRAHSHSGLAPGGLISYAKLSHLSNGTGSTVIRMTFIQELEFLVSVFIFPSSLIKIYIFQKFK